MSRSNLTDKLFGYTNVAQLEFRTDISNGISDLTLRLRRPGLNHQNEILAKFSNVSKLTIKDLGGGISQFLFLSIEDISEDQLDRINYRIQEKEKDSISFYCQSITIESIP